MSKKIKLHDLSIVNFDQKINVDGIKGGITVYVSPCWWDLQCKRVLWWENCKHVWRCNFK